MKSLNKFTILLLFAIFLFNFQATAQDADRDQNKQQSSENVLDLINGREDLSTFSDLIEEAQLRGTLEEGGPFTILAPTNEAFEKWGVNLDELKQNKERLRDVVLSHIHQGHASAEVMNEFRNTMIKDGNLEASNGIIHVVSVVVRSNMK